MLIWIQAVLEDKLLPEIRRSFDTKFLLVGMDPEGRDAAVSRGETQGVTTFEEGSRWAEKLGLDGFMECSLVTLRGIENVFNAAARLSLGQGFLEKPKCKPKGKGFLCFKSSSAVESTPMRPPPRGPDAEVSAAWDRLCGPKDPSLYAEQLKLVREGVVFGVSNTALSLARVVHNTGTKLTRDVVRDNILPTTKGTYFEHYLLGRRDTSLEPLAGRVTHFASHAWLYSFQALTDTLIGHAQYCYSLLGTSWPYYWIDVFIKDQHRKAPAMDEFKNAIKAAGTTVCVLDSVDGSPVALERIWCLYEYLQTLVLGAQLNVYIPSVPKGEVSERLQAVCSEINVRNAQATQPSDVELIQGE